MKHFGVFLCVLGAALLLVAGVGQWTVLGKYESAGPRKWERFDPNLENTINSFSKLVEITKKKFPENASAREKMDVLYSTVTDRFTHKDATHTLFSNWILYFAGKLHREFSHIYDPDLLISKGHSLFCDQSSYILLKLALANGIKSRHVGLDGHVVMEAWYDSDWHLYDPDLEVLPLDSAGKVLSVAQLALNQKLLDKYYGPYGAAQIVGSRENNTYATFPKGARFEWKSNVLAYVEKLMEVLKFAIPLAFIIVGLWLASRPTRRRT